MQDFLGSVIVSLRRLTFESILAIIFA